MLTEQPSPRFIRLLTGLPALLAAGLLLNVDALAQSGAEGNAIEIDLKCSVRYTHHSPPLSGRVLEVRLTLSDECNDVWPPGSRLIPVRGQATEHIVAIRAERDGVSSAALLIEFAELTQFNVRTGPASRSIIVDRQPVRITMDPPSRPPIADDPPTTNRGETAESLSDQRSQALLEEARQRMLDQDYDRSIAIYTRLLEESDRGQHATALEFMGIAYEKNGQLAQAVASYRRRLALFPDADNTRVQQRLASLLVTESAVRGEPMAGNRRWETYGGIEQEYLHYVFKPDADADSEVTQSSLMTYADLFVAHRGDRFDGRARFNLGYQRDLLDDARSPGDQALVSNAYVEVLDQALDWSTRVGRQSLYADGVLGRFDGAHASYRWRPNLSINLTGGMPVDTPRYLANDARPFVSASVDLEDVAEVFDFNLFTILQRNDGIADREAVGGEAQARYGRWFVLTQVDYDYSYNVLNSLYLQTGVRVNDRLQINARVHQYAYPFLATQNALIGQPVASINDLLDFYSESQVRFLARNRTADAFTGALSVSATLSERWQFNGDFNYTSIDETLSTADVSARPDTGPQLYYAANLIGSSVLRPSDTTILGFRLTSTRRADTSSLLLDVRLPFGASLRVGPRVVVSLRRAGDANDQTLVVEPSLRMIYRWRKRYRLELEGGGLWSSRELPEALQSQPVYPDDDERSTAYFFNLRWGVDF